MSSTLDQLKAVTTVVADSGDFALIEKYKPTDATTNPSLLLQAVKLPQYSAIVNECIAAGKAAGGDKASQVSRIMDELYLKFGCEILKNIEGRVSIEVDARLSFDTAASLDKAHFYIKEFEKRGIKKERILIKLGTTWEGVQASKVLQSEGINTNMTLIFHPVQAIAAAQVASAAVVSPFVGRIMDWYKKAEGKTYGRDDDPGVLSVREIYNYFKCHGIKTQVLGASFRNTDEILGLAGCDMLTIAPALLEQLANMTEPVKRVLDAAAAPKVPKLDVTESTFRWLINEDPMATEKLAEGIRNFAKDTVTLEKLIAEKL